ncbi:hypothetical protein [uncultured Gammaproteobacteria bacterium]|nr:hypothetical protein [uncultured Gammaproteobacteria bacterium]CAC9959723.1 hypothetical protein [uncultured Gammaproteobacteria bacterium]
MPPAVIVSITSEPESDEVTKNITNMIPTIDSSPMLGTTCLKPLASVMLAG